MNFLRDDSKTGNDVNRKKEKQVTIQSRAASRYEWSPSVEAERYAGLGLGRSAAWNQGGGFFMEGEGAKASRLRLGRIGFLSASLPIPAMLPAHTAGTARPSMNGELRRTSSLFLTDM